MQPEDVNSTFDSPGGLAPPTEQGEFVPPRPRANWPVAIGVISIVLGSLGALAFTWGAVAPFIMGSFAGIGGGGDKSMAAMAQAQRDMAGWTISSNALNVIASLLLLVSGIGISGRSRWGVSLTRAWAVTKIIVAVFAAIAGVMVQRAMFAALASQQSSGGAAVGAGMGEVFAVLGAAFTLAWAWAYPIFVLVWLSRAKVREEFSRW